MAAGAPSRGNASETLRVLSGQASLFGCWKLNTGCGGLSGVNRCILTT